MIRALAVTTIVCGLVSILAFSAAGPIGPHAWHWPPGHMLYGGRIAFGDGPDIAIDDNEPDATRTMPWTGSTELTFEVPAKVTYTQGPSASMTVTGPQRLVNHLKLDGTTLTLDGSVHGAHSRGLTVTVTGPAVSSFTLEAAQMLDIRSIATDSLSIKVEGASKVLAQGSARKLDLTIEGAGDATLDRLAVSDARIEIDGVGNVSAGPTGDASVEINGAGHVRLARTPAHLHQEVNGAGSISVPPGTSL